MLEHEELQRLINNLPDERVLLAPYLMAPIERGRAEVRRRAGIVGEYRAALRSGEPVQADRRWGVSQRTLQAWAAGLRNLRGSARKLFLSSKPVCFSDLPASVRRPALARWKLLREWLILASAGAAEDCERAIRYTTELCLIKHPELSRTTLYRWAGRYRRYGIAGLADLRAMATIRPKSDGRGCECKRRATPAGRAGDRETVKVVASHDRLRGGLAGA